MAVTWAFGRAFQYEKLQLLKAIFSQSPDIPGSYYLHISTTPPAADGTGISEYSGNGYASVQIPAWVGAENFGVFTDSALTADGAGDKSVQLWGTFPTASVIFPNPTAQWWANGTTVYPYATDAAVGGNPRWWWTSTPATAPTPGHPLQFAPGTPLAPNLAIAAGGRWHAPNPSPGVFHDPGEGLQSFLVFGFDVLTGNSLTYTVPTMYAGWHNYWWSHGTLATTDYLNGLDVDPGPNQRWTDNVPSLPGDGGYARQAISWGSAAIVSGKAQISNSAAISWTIGDVQYWNASGYPILWDSASVVDSISPNVHPDIQMLCYGTFTSTFLPSFPSPANGDTIRLDAGAIVFTLD